MDKIFKLKEHGTDIRTEVLKKKRQHNSSSKSFHKADRKDQ